MSEHPGLAKGRAPQDPTTLEAERANGEKPEDSTPATPARRDVPLYELPLGDSTQARARLEPTVIVEYAEAMQRGDTFPPVILFWEGERFWVGDGYHRIAAAQQARRVTIRAEVRQGGQREALFYACAANTRHGHRRTNADKRKAVDLMLKDPEWGQWSSNQIAKHCGVSDGMVRQRRDSLPKVGSDGGQRTYVTKHGTVATMDTSHIGTHAATPASGNGTPAQPARRPRRHRPPAAEVPVDRPWYYLVAGVTQVLLDFGHSGGLEPILAGWSPEARTHARGQLRGLLDQLERLDAALSAADRPKEQEAEALS
jgi:hypothetical protein